MFESKKKKELREQVQRLVERGLLEYVRDDNGKLVPKTTPEGVRIIQLVEDFSSGDRARRATALRRMRRVQGSEYRKLRPDYLKNIRVVGRDRKSKPLRV